MKGTREKTVGGLTKANLTTNKRGKVVSKKRAARGKKMYKKHLSAWTQAFMKARKQMGIKGFVACKKRNQIIQNDHEILQKLNECFL